MNSYHRYEGLVNYVLARYHHVAEIGIGHFPDVALTLQQRGVRVFATDIKAFHYKGLTVIMDNIMSPNLTLYDGLDLIYSLKPHPELVPFMLCLARRLSTDLIIKSLSSEYLNGKLIRNGNTTFYLWSNQ